MEHRSHAELLERLDVVRSSPSGSGTIEMIVSRPRAGERIVSEEAALHPDEGLVGDNWRDRRDSDTADGRPDPDTQITLINSRFVDLIAGSRERWPLAGDQLYVDFDLSEDSLPPGTELQVGSARLVITAVPHTGCGQFAQRYGRDALKITASPEGRRLRLRGVYARVLSAGTLRRGDRVQKTEPDRGAGHPES